MIQPRPCARPRTLQIAIAVTIVVGTGAFIYFKRHEFDGLASGRVLVWMILTNEERQIARETAALLQSAALLPINAQEVLA